MPKGNQGNKGKNKGKKRARQQQKSIQRTQDATRNVQLQNQPYIDALNSQYQQQGTDFQRMMQGARSIYGGATDALKGLEAPNFGGIADDFTERLGTLGGMFQGGGVDTNMYGLDVGMPSSEVQAAQGLGTAIGAGGLENLSSFAARNEASQGAAERESVLAGRYAQDNLLQQMQDAQQQYNQAIKNQYAQYPMMIESEEDKLRQEALERRLAMSQIKGDKAFSSFLQDFLGSQVGGGGGGGRGNNGPGRQPFDTKPNVPGVQSQGTDTGVGGNDFPGPGPGANLPPRGPQGQQGQAIPNAWENADSWWELPGLVKNAYTRDPGTTLRSAYGSSNHPSFNQFSDFQKAYKQFLSTINALYRDRGSPPWTGAGI